MKARKQYNNPPLVEAVVEVHFEASNFSAKTAFEFWYLVKKRYPEVTQRDPLQQLAITPDGKQSLIESKIDQFWDESKSNLIQLGSNLLTINCLPPYEGWENYKERILYAVDNLGKVLKISKILRVDVRTINKIDIGAHKIENLKEYFKVYPHSPEGIFDNTTSLQVRIETSEPNDSAFLLSTATTRKELGFEAPVVFDLAYVKITPIDKRKLEPWLDAAHERLGSIFESILTDYAKDTFN